MVIKNNVRRCLLLSHIERGLRDRDIVIQLCRQIHKCTLMRGSALRAYRQLLPTVQCWGGAKRKACYVCIYIYMYIHIFIYIYIYIYIYTHIYTFGCNCINSMTIVSPVDKAPVAGGEGPWGSRGTGCWDCSSKRSGDIYLRLIWYNRIYYRICYDISIVWYNMFNMCMHIYIYIYI